MNKREGSRLLVAIMALAMIIAGAAVVFSDSSVDAEAPEGATEVFDAKGFLDAISSDATAVSLEADITVDSCITIKKGFEICGNGHAITADSESIWSGNGTKNILTIAADGVSIHDVVFDSNNAAYGINTWNADVTISDVTSKGSKGAGLSVNGGTVSVEGLTASGNVWGSINVDNSGTLTITGSNDLGDGFQIYSEDVGENGSTINAEGYTEYGWTKNADEGALFIEDGSVEGLIIPENETVTIGEGKTMNVTGTLDVRGTLVNNGTLTNEGSLVVSGTILNNSGSNADTSGLINKGVVDVGTDGKILSVCAWNSTYANDSAEGNSFTFSRISLSDTEYKDYSHSYSNIDYNLNNAIEADYKKNTDGSFVYDDVKAVFIYGDVEATSDINKDDVTIYLHGVYDQTGSSLTIASGKSVSTTIANGGDKVKVSGLTAGDEPIVFSPGSVIISGTISAGSTATIAADGTVELDGDVVVSNGSTLTIETVEDGTSDVIIKNLVNEGTLNIKTDVTVTESLDNKEGAKIFVSEKKKIVTDENAEINSAGDMVVGDSDVKYYPDYADGTQVTSNGITYTIYHATYGTATVQYGIATDKVTYTGDAITVFDVRPGVETFDSDWTVQMSASQMDGEYIDAGTYKEAILLQLLAKSDVDSRNFTINQKLDLMISPAESDVVFTPVADETQLTDSITGADMYGMAASDLYNDLVIDGTVVTGTSNHVTGYTGFNIANPNEQHGYYIAIKFDGSLLDGSAIDWSKAYVKAGDKEFVGSFDGFLVILVNDEDDYTITVDLDGDGVNYAPTEYTLDLSGLALVSDIDITEYKDDEVYGASVSDLQSGVTITDADNGFKISGGVHYYDGIWNDAVWPNNMSKGYYLVFSVTTHGTWDDAVVTVNGSTLDTDPFDGYLVKFLGNDESAINGSLTIAVDLDGTGTKYVESTCSVAYDLESVVNIGFGIITDKNQLYNKNVDDIYSELSISEDADTISFAGTLKWVSGYTGFSSIVNEQRGYYLPFTIDLPGGMDWNGVRIVTTNGDNTKTWDGTDAVFDGYLVWRIMNDDARTISIEIDGTVYEFDLDISGLDFETIGGYGATSGEVESILDGYGITLSDVADQTMFMVYNAFGYETVTYELRYDGELIYSEIPASIGDVPVWYFSFAEGSPAYVEGEHDGYTVVKALEGPVMGGEYTLTVMSEDQEVASKTVNVTGTVAAGYDEDADVVTAEIQAAGVTVDDAIDKTMYIVWNNATAMTETITAELWFNGKNINFSESSEAYSAWKNEGKHIWYFSFNHQLQGIQEYVPGVYTMKVLAGDDVIAESEVVVSKDSSVTFEDYEDDGTFEETTGKVISNVQGDLTFNENGSSVKISGDVYFLNGWDWYGTGDYGYFAVFNLELDDGDVWDNSYVKIGDKEWYDGSNWGIFDGALVVYLGMSSEDFPSEYKILVDLDNEGTVYSPTEYVLDFTGLDAELAKYVIEIVDEKGDNFTVMDYCEGDILPMISGAGDGFRHWVAENGDTYVFGSMMIIKSALDADGDNVIRLTAVYGGGSGGSAVTEYDLNMVITDGVITVSTDKAEGDEGEQNAYGQFLYRITITTGNETVDYYYNSSLINGGPLSETKTISDLAGALENADFVDAVLVTIVPGSGDEVFYGYATQMIA